MIIMWDYFSVSRGYTLQSIYYSAIQPLIHQAGQTGCQFNFFMFVLYNNPLLYHHLRSVESDKINIVIIFMWVISV